LRELAADATDRARLFVPRTAYRTRDGNDEAEATPPEVPLGENPPNGAFLDYVVPSGTDAVVRLAIVDTRDGAVVRQYASTDVSKPVDPKDVPFPAYWIVTPPVLPATPGMHRFVWDYHLGDPDGPLAAPGRYLARLSIGAQTYTRPFVLRRDPRITASDADLVAQSRFAAEIDALRRRVGDVLAAAMKRHAPDPVVAALRRSAGLIAELEQSVESADARPTRNERDAWATLRRATMQTLAHESR